MKAISVYGMVMGVAAVAGQLVGGLLIAANPAGLGWRVIFWVNVPVGIAALALARKIVPESRATENTSTGPGRLDLRGAVLFTAALVAIVLPLLDGRAHGWPAWSWACLAAGPVLLAVFAAHLRATARARRAATARPGDLRRARVPRGADLPGALLVPAGCELPAARALPAAGPRAQPGLLWRGVLGARRRRTWLPRSARPR